MRSVSKGRGLYISVLAAAVVSTVLPALTAASDIDPDAVTRAGYYSGAEPTTSERRRNGE